MVFNTQIIFDSMHKVMEPIRNGLMSLFPQYGDIVLIGAAALLGYFISTKFIIGDSTDKWKVIGLWTLIFFLMLKFI